VSSVFHSRYAGDTEDTALVTAAGAGDGFALEALVRKHQTWIYNLAMRMVGRPEDAEDVTQEVLVKVVTKLSTFSGRSSFRTWLYRIVANHVLNMKRRVWERLHDTFDRHAALIDDLASPLGGDSVEEPILVECVKTACMSGMLLCLDRRQRLVMILGGIFGVDSRLGAQILEISPASFRQTLARARKQLKNFMAEKCGLLDERNPCRCRTRTRAAVNKGLVNPDTLRFHGRTLRRVSDFVSENTSLVDDALELKMQGLFRDHPVHPSPDFARQIRKLTRNRSVLRFVEFGEDL
jgi:RNA polymerase sigma factor (sigma-70 family)